MTTAASRWHRPKDRSAASHCAQALASSLARSKLNPDDRSSRCSSHLTIGYCRLVCSPGGWCHCPGRAPRCCWNCSRGWSSRPWCSGYSRFHPQARSARPSVLLAEYAQPVAKKTRAVRPAFAWRRTSQFLRERLPSPRRGNCPKRSSSHATVQQADCPSCRERCAKYRGSPVWREPRRGQSCLLIRSIGPAARARSSIRCGDSSTGLRRAAHPSRRGNC